MTGKSGRRDFSELTAKLEKHIERLPDYAEKAQRTVQKYRRPSGGDQSAGGADTSSTGTSDAGASGSSESGASGSAGSAQSPLSKLDLTVVHDVRDKIVRWNSPEAKHHRRVEWNRRMLTLWTVLTLCCVLWALGGYFGLAGPYEGIEGALSGSFGTVVFGALAVSSGAKRRRLKRVEPAKRAPASILPPNGSAAREPMEKLARNERTMTDLLDQLARPQNGAPSGFDVEDARTAGIDASAALRGLAARLESIERARDAAPARERGGLESAVTTLRGQLDEGVESYGALVAAAGRALAASNDGLTPAKDALTDATDRLAGLAAALRELS
ncbi:hypothetical protein BJF85_19360 [Saccharomonospora sp. CUA-673]|uniref:phage shock envelope stress response protein PspM n=1 Tax=Saccharomonospora sp. CUA-673 TaxID=1904969 RepID=UPI00095D46F0|nr:hypothetical protein [Saccharomonospora sp. CUA-673]OLT44879.1 hypothetical protein BJF85_19360 [Saccharomonospora sp. CUA-673]